MRDPNRIKPVLAAIEEYWTMHPDWRLGQIICNCGREIGLWDPFYMEDNQLLDFLKSRIRIEQSEPQMGMEMGMDLTDPGEDRGDA